MSELLDLENRIKELENLKSTALFGRNYNLIGNSNSDFLIKTKGQVKILWGSKFIDLIKDGKIKVDTSFIFTKEGSKEGIYIIDDLIYLQTNNGNKINLIGESGNTFVSFLGLQNTNAELKHTALTNIGFLYPDINSINSSALNNGIIYIESEQKLYIIKNGQLTEFFIDFPNKITKLFVIAKESKDEGAIVIKGEGIENSLAFNTLYLYTNYEQSYILSNTDLYININNLNKIKISKDLVNILTDVSSLKFQSPEATSNSGFRLYYVENLSTLEIDNLIVRNPSLDVIEFIIPTYWYKNNNIISKVSISDKLYTMSLKYTNSYNIGDLLYTYVTINSELVKLPFIVSDVDGNDIVAILLIDNIDALNIVGNIIFYISNSTSEIILRRNSENIDLVEVNDFESESNINSINTRFGNLLELNKSINDNGVLTVYNGNYGIYANHLLSNNAAYTSGYVLNTNDNSSKFASTEWVNLKISEYNNTINQLSQTILNLQNTINSLEERIDNLENN